MTGWGRKRKESGTPSAYRFFAVGAAIVVFGLAAFSSRGIGSGSGGTSVLRREEVAAASLIIGADAVPAETEEEPPGYLNGKWNIWEYIGDALASAVRRK